MIVKTAMVWFFFKVQTQKQGNSKVLYKEDPGGHLYLKLDIILVKKIHIIRVVFQDQAMYVRTSFRGAKHAKLEKRVYFWSY